MRVDGRAAVPRNEREIHAKAASATARRIRPLVVWLKMIFPIPNRVQYTATMPAIQFVHGMIPPSIPSAP